jgi:archaellum component FlaG (FlaF/FlaG flagellin family)
VGGGPSTVGGGANTSSAEITHKLESEVNIHNYSIDHPNNPGNNLSKSQNNMNQSMGNVGHNDFSPDNTQFTILKAKLFNP